VSMTNSTNRVEIITSVQRRRRWTPSEKVRMVEETFEPGMTGRPGDPPAWPKPSCAPSSVTPCASIRAPMLRVSCANCQRGLPTTTRFTRIKLSGIVHPASSSQLAEVPDRVRSVRGDNRSWV
jgi:transposase-like protein